MAEAYKAIRLGKAATEFNVGVERVIDLLRKKGFNEDFNTNTKLTEAMYKLLVKEYQPDKAVKDIAKTIEIEYTAALDEKTAKETTAKVEKEETEKPKTTTKKATAKKTTAKEDTAKATEPVAKEEVLEVETKKEVKETKEKAEPKKATKKATKKEEKPKEAEKPEEKPAPKETKPTEEKVVEKKEEDKKEEVVEKPAEPTAEKEIEETKVETKEEKAKEKTEEETQVKSGPKVVGTIDLSLLSKPKKETAKAKKDSKKEDKKAEPKAKKTEKKEEKPVEKPVKAEKVEPKVETKEEVVAVEPEKVEIDTEPEKAATTQPSRDGVYSKDDANFIKTKFTKLEGPKILNKIELTEVTKTTTKKPAQPAASTDDARNKKKKRKRLKNTKVNPEAHIVEKEKPTFTQSKSRKSEHPRGKVEKKVELSEEEIQKQISETLQRLSGTGRSKSSKYRREKRQAINIERQEEIARQEEEEKIIKVAEFVTANDLATLMDVPVTQVIATCMAIGMFVSINQRLDAETISIVVDEFGFKVEFIDASLQEAIEQDDNEGDPNKVATRNPIVTVMGHVDHGKTSLLDSIRNANVIAGEAGGITQHIGAYEVKLKDGKKITFLDTPGHEAFTAMRARGAQVTDVAIIVIAADDTVMPQTKEAINHAQAAGVPIVFAINKIDTPNANPDKIKEELSKLNILVEDWGGNYQSQEISAKKNLNIDLLLEKVLLEAEMLDLKANPTKRATGTTIESALDKGRGYIAKLLVQDGTMRVGDFVLVGPYYGKVKAMHNERNSLIKEAGPSTPLLLLGLNGAPQAGEKFIVMKDERDAKQLANQRMQLQREQGIRTQKHITLDEIGRRIAIGDFKELNIIVKGDVDGSVEALADSLLKLSTEEVQVNVIHKSVGAITESDVLLASASNAVIIGFQVRPSGNAKKIAEREQIDIRLYSIIYTAINEIKQAIEGMLAPEIEEKIVCNVEVREVYHISKVGTIAGCMVLDGKITRNTRIRVIRDGIVIHTGSLGSLKRYKDDVREVNSGFECGLNINSYNDIKVGDIIEGYEEVEVKRKL